LKTVFRWFGEKDDRIPLEHIRQIPGITGVVTALADIPVGHVWPMERIAKVKGFIEKHGLSFEVIESVNVHDDVKIGLGTRDEYIENYIETIRNLGRSGVRVICYNFMPIFDWTRTHLAMDLPDGSKAMAYDHKALESTTPERLVGDTQAESGDSVLPGWEPERLEMLSKLFDAYKGIDEARLFENLVYFLERIIPVCEAVDVKMAIHPDDPPWPLFGLPRIVNNKENIQRLLDAVDSPYNGLTLCTGSLGADEANDIPDLIRTFGGQGRIHFAHVRNIKFTGTKTFHETSHLSRDGSLDMFAIMKTFHDTGFDGYIRPDHGRMIWGETGRPGYGLYDRALGITYLNGLWEAIVKSDR
jgi:mannonate dehydratase